MNIDQIHSKNERFRQAAAKMVSLLPQANLVALSTVMIRSAAKVDKLLPALIAVTNEIQFFKTLDRIEEELDEIVYSLDQLALRNRELKVPQLDEFIKYGFDLLSIYSKACDKMIQVRFKEEA